MFFKAALVGEADLAEGSNVNVEAREFMCYESGASFGTAIVSLVKHGPDIPASNFQVLVDLFRFSFHIVSTAMKMPIDRG